MSEELKRIKEMFQEYFHCRMILETDERILETISESLISTKSAGFEPAVMSSPEPNANYSGLVNFKVDLERQILDERRECEEQKLKTLDMIRIVEDKQHRCLLHLRYIELLKWEEIADIMHYSTRRCHQIHAEALEDYREKISL